MKQRIFRSFSVLVCSVAMLLVFSSFSTPQVRGGGDDAIVQLNYELSCSNHFLDLGVSDYVVGDLIQSGAPYWIYPKEGEASTGPIGLWVQPNFSPVSRSAQFSVTIYTAQNRYQFQIYIVQQGRPQN